MVAATLKTMTMLKVFQRSLNSPTTELAMVPAIALRRLIRKLTSLSDRCGDEAMW
jgi:hypothetical protein